MRFAQTKIIFQKGRYSAKCRFEDRKIFNDAGFVWDECKKVWFTSYHSKAARLFELCDESAKIKINQFSLSIYENSCRLQIPQNVKIKPFQLKGIKHALTRNKAYLAFDPGLGKTIMAAIHAASLYAENSRHCFVYVCPPFLTWNIDAEFETFAPSLSVLRWDENLLNDIDLNLYDLWRLPNMLIVPDSLISRENLLSDIRKFLLRKNWDSIPVLYIDEAHRYKNADAIRSVPILGDKASTGLIHDFERVVFLSGTPMPNRPMELFSILSKTAPDLIDNMKEFEYGRKYCAGHRTQFGWDFKGASNIEKLSAKISPFMMRVRKSEVLKELPPKTSEIVFLGGNLPAHITSLELKALEALGSKDFTEDVIKKILGENSLHVATYRRELGLLKVKASLEYIKDILDNVEECPLIFAFHTEVIERLVSGISKYNPYVITGKTPMKKRHNIVKEFQNSKKARPLVGNILTMVGHNMTRATRVLMQEFSWVSSDNEQASDRAHRIGQHSNVFVQYFVYRNSLDHNIVRTFLKKDRITAQL